MKTMYLKNVYYYVYLLITILFLLSINLLFVSSLFPNVKMLNYFNKIEYDYTLTSEKLKQDSYYIIDESYSMQLNDDNSLSGYIKATSLMLTNSSYTGLGYYKESNVIAGTYKKLEKDECSITNNISSKYNLHIGDYIFSIANDKIYKHTIVSVLKDTYNFSKPKSNEFEQYIFSGYEESKSIDARYLNFAIYSDETDKNASDYCFTNQVIKSITRAIFFQISLVFVLFALNIIIYFILNKKDTTSMLRLCNLGYSNNKLFLYISIEFFITFILMLGMNLIFAIIFNQLILYFFTSFAICITIYSINLIKLFWRLKNERWNS